MAGFGFRRPLRDAWFDWAITSHSVAGYLPGSLRDNGQRHSMIQSRSIRAKCLSFIRVDLSIRGQITGVKDIFPKIKQTTKRCGKPLFKFVQPLSGLGNLFDDVNPG